MENQMPRSRAEAAQALFCAGYNCAQAVFCAFCDLTGIPQEAAAKTASGLGGGMGRMREVCGAVSGAVLALSCIDGYALPDDAAGKRALYARVQELGKRFRERNGSIICRELLSGFAVSTGGAPAKRDDAFYKTRPCAKMVFDAAEILEQLLAEQAGKEAKA